jgi:hypothetical protein
MAHLPTTVHHRLVMTRCRTVTDRPAITHLPATACRRLSRRRTLMDHLRVMAHRRSTVRRHPVMCHHHMLTARRKAMAILPATACHQAHTSRRRMPMGRHLRMGPPPGAARRRNTACDRAVMNHRAALECAVCDLHPYRELTAAMPLSNRRRPEAGSSGTRCSARQACDVKNNGEALPVLRSFAADHFGAVAAAAQGPIAQEFLQALS